MLTRFLKNARGGIAPLMAGRRALNGRSRHGRRLHAGECCPHSFPSRPGFHSADDVERCGDPNGRAAQNRGHENLRRAVQVTDATVTPVFTTAGGSKLTLNGSAVVHTNFLGVIGISEVNISAMSVSAWGNTRLRVALVLDNTGSMASDEKIDALKTASDNLLSQLQSAAVRPEDVYVSIVPFSKGVNFGADNHAASWLRWDLWDAVNAAEQYSSRPQGVKPLSYDWTGMNTLVDNMSPVGNTNQAIGL